MGGVVDTRGRLEKLKKERNYSWAGVAREIGIGESTLFRHMRRGTLPQSMGAKKKMREMGVI
jgi:predicted DNA-binding transcriptional regulator AlpA